jgi:hypothetical protein
MRASTCFSLTLALLAGGVPAANAQSAGRTTPRVRVSIDAGAQSSLITFAGSTTKAVNLEKGAIDTTYDVSIGHLFGGGVLVRVARRFGVAVAVSSFVKRQDATVAASIPHPFFYNAPRSIDGTAAGLERNELVTHLQAAYVISSRGKLEIALSGGPSFFRATQALVSDVTYAESYPYDTATFSAASTKTVRAHNTGYHAGADVALRLSRRIGVGALVRFSRASIEFPADGATTRVKSDAGGVQMAGGVRLFF